MTSRSLSFDLNQNATDRNNIQERQQELKDRELQATWEKFEQSLREKEQDSRLDKELEHKTSLKDSLREILDLAREENKSVCQKLISRQNGFKVKILNLQAEPAKEKKCLGSASRGSNKLWYN